MEVEPEPFTENIDFLKLVENPSWRDILLGLVNSERLDPWDVDICELTSKYLQVVNSMKNLDLHVPANLILAAAILIRIKSESLNFKEDPVYLLEDVPPELSFDLAFTNIETVSELTYRAKFPRTRKVTLNELLDAVEDAMKTEMQKSKRIAISPKNLSIEFYEQIDKIDVEKIISDTYNRILQKVDSYSLTTFDEVLRSEAEPKDKILCLLALLYLNTYGFITLKQERMFGEILIQLTDTKKDLSVISVSI